MLSTDLADLCARNSSLLENIPVYLKIPSSVLNCYSTPPCFFTYYYSDLQHSETPTHLRQPTYPQQPNPTSANLLHSRKALQLQTTL